jgi:hypothetical protein
MMSSGPDAKFTRVAVAAAIGMAVVVGCAGSGAYAADDDDDELLDGQDFPRHHERS